MKLRFSLVLASLAIGVTVSLPATAISDYEYFLKQPCSDLREELGALQKAEKAINDGKKAKEKSSNTQAVVTTLLIGWPFWGNEDHGDADNQLQEIRADIKFITRAQKSKKCS